MPIKFGEHQICPKCDGSGKGQYDKTERARALRLAKRLGIDAPPIAYGSCSRCGGSGYIQHEVLPKVSASEVWG